MSHLILVVYKCIHTHIKSFEIALMLENRMERSLSFKITCCANTFQFSSQLILLKDIYNACASGKDNTL